MNFPLLSQVRHSFASVLVAAAAVAVFGGVRYAMDPLVGPHHPFILFVAAVILATWVRGTLAGVSALLLGYGAADYLFVQPRGSLGVNTVEDAVGLLFFGFVGSLTILLLAIMRRQAEALQKVNALLGREAAARERAESYLRQAAKMEAIGRLAGGVAHDFNNLLTVINGYTLMATEDARLPAELRETLTEVLAAGRRAESVTHQLLAYSRRQMLQPRVLNVNERVADIRQLLIRLLGADVAVVTDPTQDLWPVRVDPVQVDQVLLNLSTNARDAMPDGGTLTIRTNNVRAAAPVPVCGDPLPAGRYVVLAVSDSGAGMDADTLERVFEPFFTTKGVGQGTGLGLAMVHGIARQSGGGVAVDSRPGHGTTFSIYMPVVENAMSEGSQPVDYAPPGDTIR